MGIFDWLFGKKKEATKEISGDIALAGACCEICKRVFKPGIHGGACPNCFSKLLNPSGSKVHARFCVDCLGVSFERLGTCPQCGANLMHSVLSCYSEEIIQEMLKHKKEFRNKGVQIKPNGRIELINKEGLQTVGKVAPRGEVK